MKIDAMTGLAVGGFALALLYTINRNRAAVPMLAGSAAPRGTFDTQAAMQADAAKRFYENTDWIVTGQAPGYVQTNLNGVPRTGTYVPWEG